jgi:hypothetical protein
MNGKLTYSETPVQGVISLKVTFLLLSGFTCGEHGKSKRPDKDHPMIDLTAVLAAAITVLGVVLIYAAIISERSAQ